MKKCMRMNTFILLKKVQRSAKDFDETFSWLFQEFLEITAE